MGHPVPAPSPVPGAAFPHPALMLSLLVVILVVAVVTPPGSRCNDGPGLARRVVRRVFCGEKGEVREGLGDCEVPDVPPAPWPGCDDPTVGSLESTGAFQGENTGMEKGRRRDNKRRSQGTGELTLAKGIDFKPGHFLGQDGFWQVEEGRVVDREIVVIVLQDPHGRSLDAAGRGSQEGGAQRTMSTTPQQGAHTDGQDKGGTDGQHVAL